MTEDKSEVKEEVSEVLRSVGQIVNEAMEPVSKIALGYDQLGGFLEEKITEILEEVPLKRISTPPLNVAGPAVEALRFARDDETLQGFFINLIAKSLDAKSAMYAHPSFVNIIKNISSDEGLILKVFASTQQFPMIDVNLRIKQTGGINTLHRNVSMIGMLANCKHIRLINSYIDNLCRLGLLEIPKDRKLNNAEAFEELLKDQSIEQIKKQFENNANFSIEFDEKYIEVTELGIQFLKACVIDSKPH